VAHETVKITGVSERTPALLNGARHFAQQVKGDASFFYGLSLPESLTLSVASRILGSDQEKVNELVVDAASEYVNIIVGNACVQLSMNNLRVSAEPPVQVPGTSSFPSCTQRLCVELESTRAPFSVQFLFIG
jgi:CheY-specific phosphatase CheX